LGTNPNELYAAGWSSCFLSAIGNIAGKMQFVLPADRAIDTNIDLGVPDGAFFLQARFNFRLPGLGPDLAQALVNAD
jgi:lipoyl-dependent peroxiredoxin